MRNVIKAVSGWRIVLVVFALLSVVTLPSEADADEPPSIGDRYANGIVFYVDQSGRKGLVAAAWDLPGLYKWDEAQKACLAYVDGYTDWYLPSQWELNELYQHKDVVKGFQEVPSYYWSSSGANDYLAWTQYFRNGRQEFENKYSSYRVRCVRAYNFDEPPFKPWPKWPFGH